MFDGSVSQDVDGDLIEGHAKDFVVELYHLMQVDDDSDEEYDEKCCGEVEIIFCDVPEEDAKDEEDIERFDDFVDE